MTCYVCLLFLLVSAFCMLLLCMQQSVAFKILRTRLKTVPSSSFSNELKRTSSGSPYSQILQITEDSNRNKDAANLYNAINFPSRLQQFEHMQHRHRAHGKTQLQSRNSTSSTWSQVCFFFRVFFSSIRH